MRILVTGGAGFIGSALVRQIIAQSEDEVQVFDKLTYAGNLASLAPIAASPRFSFVQGDICDHDEVREVFSRFRPEAVIHLAAETHVDRSIDAPAAFIETNMVGTSVMLSQALRFWRCLPPPARDAFRFLHVSTDEVFGALGPSGFFREDTPYAPNSPYSASKAGADHLVRAWRATYGLPTLITNCSNNYGPYHFPEKLIPLMIISALEGKPLPVYGRGQQVRDWLYVEDHAAALRLAVANGVPGESYNVGGRSERRNLQVVEAVCDLLDGMQPKASGSYRDQIAFVPDRPGHDARYAIDCAKIERELGWRAKESFATGLAKTVAWYLDNEDWWRAVRSGAYRGERLGLGGASADLALAGPAEYEREDPRRL